MLTIFAIPVSLSLLGFLDEVDVMSSLQKPRKVTAVGSDGVHYTFLCKPKDDLRKDAKVMEFNSLVNTLLKKDREANRRDLCKSFFFSQCSACIVGVFFTNTDGRLTEYSLSMDH